MMARSLFQASDSLRKKVHSLAAVGLTHDDIATIIECSPKTLRKHFRKELDSAAIEANAAVVGFLMDKIRSGNVPAMFFWEKARGGRCEVFREEISGPDGGAINMRSGLECRLPCNGKGPCPREVEDYLPGDEDLPPIIPG